MIDCASEKYFQKSKLTYQDLEHFNKKERIGGLSLRTNDEY